MAVGATGDKGGVNTPLRFSEKGKLEDFGYFLVQELLKLAFLSS